MDSQYSISCFVNTRLRYSSPPRLRLLPKSAISIKSIPIPKIIYATLRCTLSQMGCGPSFFAPRLLLAATVCRRRNMRPDRLASSIDDINPRPTDPMVGGTRSSGETWLNVALCWVSFPSKHSKHLEACLFLLVTISERIVRNGPVEHLIATSVSLINRADGGPLTFLKERTG